MTDHRTTPLNVHIRSISSVGLARAPTSAFHDFPPEADRLQTAGIVQRVPGIPASSAGVTTGSFRSLRSE